MKKFYQRRNWVFTIPDYTDEEYRLIKANSNIIYLCLGKCEDKDKGRFLRVYAQLRIKQRQTTLRNVPGFSRMDVTKRFCNNHDPAAIDWCKEKAVEFETFGTLMKETAKLKVNEAVYDRVDGMTDEELLLKYGNTYLVHHSRIKDLCETIQADREKQQKSKPNDDPIKRKPDTDDNNLPLKKRRRGRLHDGGVTPEIHPSANGEYGRVSPMTHHFLFTYRARGHCYSGRR